MKTIDSVTYGSKAEVKDPSDTDATSKTEAPKIKAQEIEAPISSSPTADSKTVKPYGLFGLCVSLIVLLVFATAYALVTGLVVHGFVSGSTHIIELFGQLAADLKTGDFSGFLVLLVNASLMSLPFLTASLVVYFALSLAVLTAASFRGGNAWRSLIGWHSWAPWRAKRSYWIIAGSTLIYSFIANALIAAFYPASKDWFTVPHDNLVSAIELFVLAAVFAPIAEELLFRGWIYTSLRAQFGFWIALLISSAIFAGLHYEDTHIYALAVFPVGLALGAIRETSGSLKASISFHAFFNAVAFALAAFNLG
jgi:membrane protease YdiL (CAAX protease family)